MNRIREIRKEKGLTLKELSQQTKIPISTLGQYEREERKPKEEAIKKLAGFFDRTPEYVAGYWSNKDVLKLLQDTYIKEQDYIKSLQDERSKDFEGAEEELTELISGAELSNYAEGSPPEPTSDTGKMSLAVSIFDYLERWFKFLDYMDKHPRAGSIFFIFRKLTASGLNDHMNPWSIGAEIEKVLNKALYSENRELVLNDSYIWQELFSRICADELINALMKMKTPEEAMIIGLKYTINFYSDKLKDEIIECLAVKGDED